MICLALLVYCLIERQVRQALGPEQTMAGLYPDNRAVRPTVRTWKKVVGMVGPDDIRDLQTKVTSYHGQILVALDNLRRAGTNLPTSGKFTDAAWDELTKREEAFNAESSSELNPLAYLYAGSAYDRGRAILTELDAWRDELDSLKAPGVPPPVEVPGADFGIAGGYGMLLLVAVALYAMREFK